MQIVQKTYKFLYSQSVMVLHNLYAYFVLSCFIISHLVAYKILTLTSSLEIVNFCRMREYATAWNSSVKGVCKGV